MKILIDADACPVTDIVISEAKKHGIKVNIYCDYTHEMNTDYATVFTVEKGSDSADFAIIKAVEKSDIVITQDYGLAAMCLSKGCIVINQDGLIYNDKNIDFLLEKRHQSKKLRDLGIKSKFKKRTSLQNDEFKKVLIEIIEQNLNN